MHCGMGRATMEWCVGSCASLDVSSVKHIWCHVIDWKPRCQCVIGSIMSVAWARCASSLDRQNPIHISHTTTRESADVASQLWKLSLAQTLRRHGSLDYGSRNQIWICISSTAPASRYPSAWVLQDNTIALYNSFREHPSAHPSVEPHTARFVGDTDHGTKLETGTMRCQTEAGSKFGESWWRKTHRKQRVEDSRCCKLCGSQEWVTIRQRFLKRGKRGHIRWTSTRTLRRQSWMTPWFPAWCCAKHHQHSETTSWRIPNSSSVTTTSCEQSFQAYLSSNKSWIANDFRSDTKESDPKEVDCIGKGKDKGKNKEKGKRTEAKSDKQDK